MGRVFTNGPGDLYSIPGLKWYFIPPCLTLSNIKYVLRVKWSNPGKEVAPSPTYRRCSYWKGSLLVALDNGRQLYLSFLFHSLWILHTSFNYWSFKADFLLHPLSSPRLLELFKTLQLQMKSPPPTGPIEFLDLWKDLSIYQSSCFLSFSFCDSLGQQNPQDDIFCFFRVFFSC